MTDPNDIATKARAMAAADPAGYDRMLAAWSRICDAIESRALAKRPKPKVFEVHHETQTARLRFLTAVVGGAAVDDAERETAHSLGFRDYVAPAARVAS